MLARREHLDPDLREAFALSGTAHPLAISGFHVGVIAALLVGTLRLVGFRGLRVQVGAALGCWAYVLGIGAPHAAVRAGVLLSLFLGARLRGRPVMGTGGPLFGRRAMVDDPDLAVAVHAQRDLI